MYTIINKRALVALLLAVGVEHVLSLPTVTSTEVSTVDTVSTTTVSTSAEITLAVPNSTSLDSIPVTTASPTSEIQASPHATGAGSSSSNNVPEDENDKVEDIDSGSTDDTVGDGIDADNIDTEAANTGSTGAIQTDSSTDDTSTDADDEDHSTDEASEDADASDPSTTSSSEDGDDTDSPASILEARGKPRGGSSKSSAKITKASATDAPSTRTSVVGTATSSTWVTSKASHHVKSSKTGSPTSATHATSKTSTSSTSAGAAACTPGKKVKAGEIHARNNDDCGTSTQKDPTPLAFPANDKNKEGRTVVGLQELFDADCYAHICQNQPVVMSYWNLANKARGKGDGNGAVANGIFKTEENLKDFGTKRPPSMKDSEGKVHDFSSPEEWCPASTQQSGKTSTLIPVTVAAQNQQRVLLNNRFYIKHNIKRHDFDEATMKEKNSDKGSWFQITKFDGAKGPYCAKLNNLLQQYKTNFDNTGHLKKDKRPDICDKPIDAKDMNGLMYDVGLYAYQRDANDGKKYNFIGKKVSKDSGKGS